MYLYIKNHSGYFPLNDVKRFEQFLHSNSAAYGFEKPRWNSGLSPVLPGLIVLKNRTYQLEIHAKPNPLGVRSFLKEGTLTFFLFGEDSNSPRTYSTPEEFFVILTQLFRKEKITGMFSETHLPFTERAVKQIKEHLAFLDFHNHKSISNDAITGFLQRKLRKKTLAWVEIKLSHFSSIGSSQEEFMFFSPFEKEDTNLLMFNLQTYQIFLKPNPTHPNP